jgi:Xaa-Pro aminopeptidase
MKALDSLFFTHNRELVIEKLQGGMLVIAGYTGMQKSNDEEFRFTQESNMWYLTGVEFPDWWLIIDAKTGKSWLVEPTIDERHRLFTESLAVEDAKRKSGITNVISRDQAMTLLRRSAKLHPIVYTIGVSPYTEYFNFALNPAISDMRSMLDRIFVKVEDFRLELSRIRAIKQPIEIEFMQKSIDLTIKGLNKIKENLHIYKNEYVIEAELEYIFRMAGGSSGFDPIIAGGANATVAHYFQNNAPLKKGTLIMMDVGAKLNGYPADITRTYAVGKPTKRMQNVHEAVHSARSEIISLIKPGLSVSEYQNKSDVIIKREMVQLGIITSLDDEDGYRRHMPHALSHGLGIDVHDSLGKSNEFKPGMVLTVEPGIYIPSEGIGVRIEDDILVTDSGYKNLSAKLSTDL